MEIFMFLLIVIAIVMPIVSFYQYRKRVVAEEENTVLKDDNVKLSNAYNTTHSNLTTALQEVSNKEGTIIALAKDLTKVKSKLTAQEETLNTTLVFVTEEGNPAINVKVKTETTDDGKTTLYPTIRRKVNNKWKEVPVFIKYSK